MSPSFTVSGANVLCPLSELAVDYLSREASVIGTTALPVLFPFLNPLEYSHFCSLGAEVLLDSSPELTPSFPLLRFGQRITALRVSATSSATMWTITCPSSLQAVNYVYSSPLSGSCDPSQCFLPEGARPPLPPYSLILRTSFGSVLGAWPCVGARDSVDMAQHPAE